MAFLTGLHPRSSSSTDSSDPENSSTTHSYYLNDIVNTMMGSSPSSPAVSPGASRNRKTAPTSANSPSHHKLTMLSTKLLEEQQQQQQHSEDHDLEMSNSSKYLKASGGGGSSSGGHHTLKAKDSNLSGNNSTSSTMMEHHHPDGDGGSNSLATSKQQHPRKHAFSAAHIKALSACGLYSFCSVSMILTNKSLASSYNHLIDGELNILLVVFQAVVAVLCVEFCKRMGWVDYPQVTMDVAKSWAPVNLFFCGMLFTGMASLASNSVPMVTVFKNVTNVATTAGDYFFFGNRAEPLVLAAFGVMLFGAIAAAWNDITVTSTGLFWMGANCITTSGYVLYMKHATQHVKLSKFGMVYVNNVLCVFFLLPAAMVMGEVTIFLTSDRIHTLAYFSKNFWAGFVGFFLNFASLNCVQVTGPTTYAIVGSLNKVPVTFLGYIFFDNAISWETWCYISVSMCGGFLYSYAMIQSSRKDRQN